MYFECGGEIEKEYETWHGEIKKLINYGSHYEMFIESRSSIMVLFGETTRGNFVCIPDFNAGSHLSSYGDRFWNTERLIEILGKVDGITVAIALSVVENQKLIKEARLCL